MVIVFGIPSKPENTCQSEICLKRTFQNVNSKMKKSTYSKLLEKR